MLNFAFNVPGLASNPACTIPELALLVPQATSLLLSSTKTLASYLDNSLAIEQPITPAPMMIIFFIILSYFDNQIIPHLFCHFNR